MVFRKVHKDCYFKYLQNYYSVPHAYVGKTVEVKVYADCLKVVEGGKVIADHRTCPYRHQFIKEASHFQGIVRRRRGALEDYRRSLRSMGKRGRLSCSAA